MNDRTQPTLGERLVKLETLMEGLARSLTTLLIEVKETKQELREHVKWEVEQKYPEIEDKFALKETSLEIKSDLEHIHTDISATNKELLDLPDNLAKKFASIWTEHFIKGVLVTVIGGGFLYFIIQ